MDRVRAEWIRLFETEMHSSATVYWELLSYLWAEGGGARKTDALRSTKSVKSLHTAGKYIEAGVSEGMLEECENHKNARSRLIVLTPPQTKRRMDAFLDWAVDELQRSSDAMHRKAAGMNVLSREVGRAAARLRHPARRDRQTAQAVPKPVWTLIPDR